MYKMRTTTQQTESWFTLCIVLHLPSSSLSDRNLPVTSVFSCIACIQQWHHESLYLMASLLLYGPVNSFKKREKQKHLMFVCTICCLGTESNVYKTGELKNKAELKDRKACCIKPVWLKIMVFSEKYKGWKKRRRREYRSRSYFIFATL